MGKWQRKISICPVVKRVSANKEVFFFKYTEQIHRTNTKPLYPDKIIKKQINYKMHKKSIKKNQA